MANTNKLLSNLSISKIWNMLNKHEERPVNNNILINSNFANPVNQRGETTKTSAGYWIDRWKMNDNNSAEFSIVDGGIQCVNSSTDTYGNIYQLIEFPEQFLGKNITLSVCIDDEVYTLTLTMPDNLEVYWKAKDFDCGSISLGINQSLLLYAQISTYPTYTSGIIQWAKMELGEVATPYVPRLYAEEYLLCQRYYQIVDRSRVRIKQTTANVIKLISELPYIMRINGTLIMSDAIKPCIAETPQDGWIIHESTSYASSGMAEISFYKESHGLTEFQVISLTLSEKFAIDAEL